MSSKYYHNLSGPVRRHARQRGVDGMFAWTIFIFLLIGFALFCWMGSFYIFGHPEKAANYRLLKRLHKIEEPQRFEITSAPRGEFLKPAQLLERFGRMTPQEITRTNEVLLRNFLRNYHQTHDLVTYAVGTYRVLEPFPLTEKNFVHSGMTALLQAVEQPEVLLEQIFPAEPDNLPALEKALQTGQEVKLDKPFDLSAVIFIERLHDGRIKLTTMPLLYGTYGTKQDANNFELEPPSHLDLETGPPLLTAKEITAADEKYFTVRGKADFSPTTVSDHKKDKTPSSINAPITRIIPTVALEEKTATKAALPKNVTNNDGGNFSNNSQPTISRALPVNVPAILPAIPITPVVKTPPIPAAGTTTSQKALPATPINNLPTSTSLTATATTKSTPVFTTSIPTPAPTPTITNTVATSALVVPVANTTGGVWPIYDSGKMPRGRLIDASEISPLAERGIEGERLYLQGNFAVTASGQDRAVLRYSSVMSDLPISRTGKIRIIVAYPIGVTPPAEGTSLTRDQQRPFMIVNTKKEADGTINLYVREITRP